jgi:RNA polymerase sigma factor for flagellar operon FliA
MTSPPPDEGQLWERYKATGHQSVRDQLLLRYTPLVKYVAGRVAAGFPDSVEQADLESYGTFGLIDAIDKFEPERGYKFKTYAINRIRGAILDELRTVDPVPRSVRAKARAIDQAQSRLEGDLHRTPTAVELAGELDLTDHQFHVAAGQVAGASFAALDEILVASVERGEATSLGDTIPDGDNTPLAAVELEALRMALADAIGDMPVRDNVMLTLYYAESLTFAEIGQVLGVTESRVCQIHTQVAEKLKTRLLAREPI